MLEAHTIALMLAVYAGISVILSLLAPSFALLVGGVLAPLVAAWALLAWRGSSRNA